MPTKSSTSWTGRRHDARPCLNRPRTGRGWGKKCWNQARRLTRLSFMEIRTWVLVLNVRFDWMNWTFSSFIGWIKVFFGVFCLNVFILPPPATFCRDSQEKKCFVFFSFFFSWISGSRFFFLFPFLSFPFFFLHRPKAGCFEGLFEKLSYFPEPDQKKR